MDQEKKKEGLTQRPPTKAVAVPRKGRPADGSHKQVAPHHSCRVT